jgi:hypothetical protein
MSQRDVAVVRSYMAHLYGQDPHNHEIEVGGAGTVSAVIHPDCELVNPLLHPARGIVIDSAIPADGVIRGSECLSIDLRVMTENWVMEIVSSELIDVGEFVMLKGRSIVSGRARGGPPTKLDFVELFWITDERVGRIEVFVDTKAFADAL